MSHTTEAVAVDDGDAGYHKGLKSRQVQMIAMGGAIGTGLFRGASGRLVTAGPSLAVVYAIVGVVLLLVLGWFAVRHRVRAVAAKHAQ